MRVVFKLGRGQIIVKKFGLLLIAVCMAGMVSAGTVESQIAERIKKIGTVCIEGNDCAEASSGGLLAGAGNDGAGAEANYKKTCATCHAIGVAGAPKLGDTAAWEPRIAKGIDVLYQSAVGGMPPGMPAKGMCFTCSDDDLRSIVDYMVDQAK